MTEVFIVGHHGPEHNHIESAHQTYEGALNAWNKLRLELIERVKEMSEFCQKEGYNDNYKEMIEKLSCEDPDKIDNYPQETPYIQKWEVKE